MKMAATLSRYIAGLYFKYFIFLLLGLLAVIYLFDTVELIRRASKFDALPISLVLQMGLLKLPEVGQILFPFAILFGGMFTFWQLNRRHELVVFRSAGVSVWQLLAPVMLCAVLIGVFQVTVINPVGALLIGKFEHMERSYLSGEQSEIAVFQEGLWLRQSVRAEDYAGQDDYYVILHAAKIRQEDWALQRVNVMYFDRQDNFLQRLDAKEARLEPQQWVFTDAVLHNPQGAKQEHALYALPTTLTMRDIEDSFASPETMSFWQLPAYIKTLEGTGFETSSLRVHYHNLLAQPLLFAAMILLAATVSMRPPRLRGGLILISVGVFTGFVVFFLSSFLQALGASQQIPVILAAWSPALICFMLGLSMVINLEDG